MRFPLVGKISGYLSLLSAAWMIFVAASSPPLLEYQVKAVYIYKLLKFVDWPEGTFPPDNNVVVIGVLGDSPVREALETLKHTHSVPIQTVRLRSLKEISSVHVLFVSSSAPEPLESVFEASKGTRCITIGETKDFAYLGGMINLVIDDEKVKFEVNLKVMKDAGLAIGSRVLRAAIKIW